MTTDLIVCWPRTCDYPSFRRWLAANRGQFDQAIIVFTDLAGPTDYSAFVREALPATYLDSPVVRDGRDWRDVAVNAALDASGARRVFFTEQDVTLGWWPPDWLPLVGWDADDGRPFHPSALWVDRRLIDRTSRYFGPDPVDHFCQFGRDLVAIQRPFYLIREQVTHMQAITESQMLVGLGERPRFHPERFAEWLREQLTAGVPLHPEWEARARDFLR